MIYAPVCIPTLNRYEHLRKCLESLSRCSWADQTEVYVALDYPPTDQWEKYAPGWEKNRDFLHSCGDIGFKKLHVIEREENYGIWLPGHKGNGKCLVEDIRTKYDRYIVSEDDNIFAPAFLEFMDKGLEMFENDEKVYSLVGYKFYYPLKKDNNTFLRQDIDCTPWGIAYWTKKELPDINYKWYRKRLSIKKIIQLKNKYGWAVVAGIINKCNKNNFKRRYIDGDIWSYMQMTGTEQIIPTTTLVHNIGLDGSGNMHDAVSRHEEWCDPANNPISTEEHFEFIGSGYEYEAENRKIYYHGKYWQTERHYFIKTIRKIIKTILSK